MTARSRWMALVCIVGLAVGMIRVQFAVSTLCLAILFWMLLEWILFSWRVARELALLDMTRSVNGRCEPSGVLWAGRSMNVRLELNCRSSRIHSVRLFRDVLPENLEILPALDGNSTSGARSQKQNTFGKAHEKILELFRIPTDNSPANQLIVRSTRSSVTVQYTARVRAAGEVVFPGVRIEFWDPMRLFRRDRFVTLQQTFRVLPGFSETADATPIVKRMNSIPRQGIHRQQRAGVGFELLELREYVEGDPPKAIAWKASARRNKLMTRQYESEVPVRVQLIVDGTASTRIGGFGHRLLDQMTHVAASIAHSVTSVGDSIGSYLVNEHGVHRTQAASGTAGFYQQMRAMAVFSTNRLPPSSQLTPELIQSAYAVCSERYPELLAPEINPTSFHSLAFFSTHGNRQRTQLAAIMAELHHLTIQHQVELAWNDVEMAKQLSRFLSVSGMPWMAPIVSSNDALSFRSPNRCELLTKALLSAIANARDNEVFVVIAELLGNSLSPDPKTTPPSKNFLDEFMDAVVVAKAKHHRIAVICPSPTFLRPKPMSIGIQAESVEELRLAAEHVRLRELALPLKRRLTKLGVPMAITGETKAMQTVLSEIAIARSGRLVGQGRNR